MSPNSSCDLDCELKHLPSCCSLRLLLLVHSWTTSAAAQRLNLVKASYLLELNTNGVIEGSCRYFPSPKTASGIRDTWWPLCFCKLWLSTVRFCLKFILFVKTFFCKVFIVLFIFVDYWLQSDSKPQILNLFLILFFCRFLHIFICVCNLIILLHTFNKQTVCLFQGLCFALFPYKPSWCHHHRW